MIIVFTFIAAYGFILNILFNPDSRPASVIFGSPKGSHNKVAGIIGYRITNMHQTSASAHITSPDPLQAPTLYSQLIHNAHDNKSSHHLPHDKISLYKPLNLWPYQERNDRIHNQLTFAVPPSDKNHSTKIKRIAMAGGITSSWGDLRAGRQWFLDNKCRINTCEVVNANELGESDALLIRDGGESIGHDQLLKEAGVIILFSIESPLIGFWPDLKSFAGQRGIQESRIWIATYRNEADLVTPYEKFLLHDPNIKYLPQKRNWASGKRKKVAWFVSNCNAISGRQQYADYLRRYIQVDIFGSCGSMQCEDREKCYKMLAEDYKFYLSFENAICDGYITEKFFRNGLMSDVLPIVLGPPRKEYEAVAPYKSFIHVNDFSSPKELAEYLHQLDKNDTLYNEYFQWKGTGSFINTKFFCRVCAMLHAPPRRSRSEEEMSWYPGNCRTRHAMGNWEVHLNTP